jgi:hypothetical protein
MSRRSYYLGVVVIMIAIFVGALGLSWNHARELAAVHSGASADKEATPADWPHSEDSSMPRVPSKTMVSASTPTAVAQPVAMRQEQSVIRRPSALSEWREHSYLSALQAPILIEALHSGSTLEVSRAPSQLGHGEVASQTTSSVTGAMA